MSALVSVVTALIAGRQARHARVEAEMAGVQASAALEQARYMRDALELQECQSQEGRAPRFDLSYRVRGQTRGALVKLEGPEPLSRVEIEVVRTVDGSPVPRRLRARSTLSTLERCGLVRKGSCLSSEIAGQAARSS